VADLLAPLDDIARYDYLLPPERIAQRPVSPREAARLLVLPQCGSGIEHRRVADLPELLRPGDLLVVNETRVVAARLLGRIAGRDREIEILLTREAAPGIWLAWVRPARALREGDPIEFPGQTARFVFLGREGETATLRVDGEIADLIGSCGHVPLPPYIRRPDDAADREDYQTIFARLPGAVAAPTAGLHFTEPLVEALESRGIEIARLSLHVGPGTFRPLRTPDLREHRVESEYYAIEEGEMDRIAGARRAGRRIVAVGTTTTRALESWARSESRGAGALAGWTDLTIVPPFAFAAVDVLMTNFHLPRSSLLLMVCAFGGRDRILHAYREAVERGYRFYSYGDAMLIFGREG